MDYLSASRYSFVVLCLLFCRVDAKDCSSLSCPQNKTCIQIEKGDSFCNNCSNDKVGLNCNIDNPCIDDNQCLAQYCTVSISKNGNSSKKCLDDPCVNGPCANNGVCYPTEGTRFECRCGPQWKGPKCKEDVDECASNPCQNSGTCNNRVGDFICLCMAGFSGNLCEINVDDCLKNPCLNNGTCIDLVASYRCQCPPNKAGLRCQLDNPCTSNPCMNGSSCSVGASGNYSCICGSGWKGVNCDEDIDECSETSQNICEQGGTCINKLGSFKCLCPQGLSGDRCEMTLDNCHPKNPCQNGGTCIPNQGQYACYCLSGFTGDTCNESDVCQEIDCNGAGCIFVDNQYKCNCPSNTTGQHCEYDSNGLCLRESCRNNDCSKCQNGAKCSGRNSSVCECRPGFYGHLCQYPDHCYNRPCSNGGHCTLQEGGRRCACLPGYSGDSCEIVLPCLDGCLNGGSCRPSGSSGDGFLCQCRVGFKGKRCEDVSPCETSRPCSNGGMCVDVRDNADGYICQCPDSWKGQRCTTPVCDSCRCCTRFGVCQDICNHEECKSIDRECKSVAETYPYKSCGNAKFCSEVFKDEKCDLDCNNEDCLYDGFDCKTAQLTCPYEATCRPLFENGNCDKQCYNLLCMWDGTDCDHDKELVQGIIIIKLFVEKTEFEKKMMSFLYDLSRQLTCTVKLSKNQDGSPAISEVDIPGFGKGVEVRLKLVYTSSIDACFKYVGSAGDFIKKVNENKTITDFPMYDISTAPDPSTSGQTPIFIIIGAIFCLLTIVLLVGLWIKKRKKVDKTWFPPGFSRSNKTCIRSSTDQMSSGSEKQVIEGSDSFSEESFYTGTLSKASKLEFPGDMATNHMKVPHANLAMCAASSVSYNHQINYFANNFRPPINTPLQDDIFSKIVNEATFNYNQTGETPLHLAARYSRADAAQKFLEDGADPNAQDHDGKTPLHVAIAADAVGVFQILLRCRTCSVNVQMKDGTTPLICAVRLAVDGMVGDLIKAEADLNKTDDQGKTGLHWASAVNNLDAAILLLHHGGLNRDAQDDKGQTPLFLAAKEGSFNVAQLLLHNSASMDLADQLDRLPRDIAIEKKHYDIVKLLEEYMAKANQNRGQTNFSDHLLISEGAKALKQKNKSLPHPDMDGSGRSKKKRKIDMMDALNDANQGEMFAANFRHANHHFDRPPYGYMAGHNNAGGKQMYNQVLHWNKHNNQNNDFMSKESIRLKSQKGPKRRNDMDKWFIGSTGSSPTDSDFAVIQSPNEGSNGSPGYCNNGGVFLSPSETDHYQHHMMAAGDGMPRCMPASVIQRYHANPVKNSQHMQTSYGQYDYHDGMTALSKPIGSSVVLPQNKQNVPLIFQQYPTPPSQQFSPNGISSSAQASCLNTTQRENLFETPSPGAGDQWVDISMATCVEPHARQQLDNMMSNESSVC